MQIQQLKLSLDFDHEPELYLDKSRWGFFSIFTRKFNAEIPEGQKGRFKCEQKAYQLNELPNVIPLWQQRGLQTGEDVYITQASFSRPNRKKVNVATLGQLFIDIDYYNSKSPLIRHAEPEQILEMIQKKSASVGLPPPNIAMFSGRGVYLKWVHDPLPAKVLKKWEYAQQCLNALFEEFGADKNAKDASRVLRLENTLNHKSGLKSEIMTVETSAGQLIRYRFSDLCDVLLPKTNEEFREFKERLQLAGVWQATTSDKTPRKDGIIVDSRELFGYLKLNNSRFRDIMKLADLRSDQHGFLDKDREKFLWVACNYFALSNVHVRGLDLWQEFYQIAAIIAPHWEQAKIRSCLGIIFGKYKETAEGKKISFGGKEYTPLYTHKNRTLIDLFEMTPDEQRAMETIISKEIKAERHAKRQENARRAAGMRSMDDYNTERSQNKESLREQVIALTVKGWKRSQIAEYLGISPRYVSILKKVN